MNNPKYKGQTRLMPMNKQGRPGKSGLCMGLETGYYSSSQLVTSSTFEKSEDILKTGEKL